MLIALHNPAIISQHQSVKNAGFILLLIFMLLFAIMGRAQNTMVYNAISPGIPWFDDRMQPVSAHGANIIKEGNKFYLFGEAHTDTSNDFTGFNCYSSADLYNWKFEGIALPVQNEGKLGPRRVGERPKVMKCPQTGEYVMYMHVDTLGYTDQFIGYATSKHITGPYTFMGPVLFNGKPIRKWDMGTFQDHDGAGYILIHGGEIYQLSNDYKSVSTQVNKSMTSGFESPAMFHKNGVYYLLGSALTSWEKNDNYYYTAPSINGPWTARGLFAPKGTLTWNSQTTFVLPVTGTRDTTYLFMGDRWSYPKQASAATYVWQPLIVNGTALSMPAYYENWQLNTKNGQTIITKRPGNKLPVNGTAAKHLVTYQGSWKHQDADSIHVSTSDEKGASVTIRVKGTRVGWYGTVTPDGGYASVVVKDSKQQVVLSSVIDYYCKYSNNGLRFLTPKFARGNYTITVTVMHEHGNWTNKRKDLFGSTGYQVSVSDIVIAE